MVILQWCILSSKWDAWRLNDPTIPPCSYSVLNSYWSLLVWRSMSPAFCLGMIDAVILINTVSIYHYLHQYQYYFHCDRHRYQSCTLDYHYDSPHDLDHLDHHDHDYRLDFPHPLSHICFVLSFSLGSHSRLCHDFPCHQTFSPRHSETEPSNHQGLITAIALSEDDVYAAVCVILNMPLGLVDVLRQNLQIGSQVLFWSIFRMFWRYVVDTLLGTNISSPKGTFEDDVPFPKVGYVSSRRVHDHVVCRCTSCTCILLAFCMLFAVNSSSNTHLNLSFSWQFMYARIHIMNDDDVIRYFHLAWSRNA